MPWVNPMLFGTNAFDAIIRFGSCSSAGQTLTPLYNSPITVLNDSQNIFGTAQNYDPNIKWVPFNVYGDFKFTVISPATFTSKQTAQDVDLGWAGLQVTPPSPPIGINQFFKIFTVYTNVQQNPSPTDVTVTNVAYLDVLLLRFPSQDAYQFDGMTIGVKKL